MPCASRDELPLQQITPSYSTRMADWGGMTVGIEAAPAGMDASSSLEGLPDGRCQAHHWGYLLSGRIVADYGDRQETVVAGQAYYIEPGHRISFEEDSEAIEFTPTAELERTLEVVRGNVARAERSAG
ncbi:MAG: cupin domain-containing protein [Actinobacteria bacterium]|nr:cupin domain-containing protein [Actinomycetota bacterium]